MQNQGISVKFKERGRKNRLNEHEKLHFSQLEPSLWDIIRLGDLYKSKLWGQVIGLLEMGAGAEDVASASLTAAERGFRRASDDLGMRYTVWLLTQVTLASRKDDFSGELNRLGLEVSKKPGLFEVVGAFTKNIDDYLTKHKARSDVSEMAQFAAVETLSEKSMQRSRSLFGTTPEDVHQAIREISTKKNFASSS